jgi:hypothetical protein
MPHRNDRPSDPQPRDGRPRRPRRTGRWLTAGVVGATTAALAGTLAGTALAWSSPHRHHHPHRGSQPPIVATVFSPGNGDHSGANGVGFIVDVALDARRPAFNHLIDAASGYHPYFNDPSAPTFHPGPDPGAPGLVVLLSSTPDKAGTPFQGPDTNLAGLFQINGVATVPGGLAETWNTWQPGKAVFGSGPTTLTVYAVRGTAPAVIPAHGLRRISNVVRVHFDING